VGDHGECGPPSVEELSYAEKRTEVTEWLADHGWEASATTIPEAVAHYGRGSGGTGEKSAVPSVLISGRRPK
jgi:O-methyltransferase involved in polyketide biosynthesis